MSDRESKHPTWELYYAVERDLRAGLAKLSELGVALSSIDLPDPLEAKCPLCGIKTKGPRSLAEHLYHSHDAEVPETWERIETLTGS